MYFFFSFDLQDRPENSLLKELEKAKGHAEENLKQLSLYQNESELKLKSLSISSESSSLNSLDSYNQAMLMINSLSAIVNDVHGKSQFCVENLKEKQCNLESNQFNTPLSAKRKQKLTIGSFGLYHTYLAICEANAICWHLKKNIVNINFLLFKYHFVWCAYLFYVHFLLSLLGLAEYIMGHCFTATCPSHH